MTGRITLVGSYNVGLFLKGARLPEPGETVIADAFVESGGGKGSNQAVAASLLGADVRFVGRIGSDRYGEDALAMYRRVGIDTAWVRVDDTVHSGISVILIDAGGQNLISVAPGANLNLSPGDIDAAEKVLRESLAVGFQLENGFETVEYGLRKVRSLGVSTFLDPAPARKLPDDLYASIDIIKPNETEASILTGIRVDGPDAAEKAGRWFLDRGVGTAIVTLGEGGAVLATEVGPERFAAPAVEAVDATGAGDIFSGGFLAALCAGESLKEAILFALHAASLSTEKLGVIESIPNREEVEAFMRRSLGRPGEAKG
jgi:ribokinase